MVTPSKGSRRGTRRKFKRKARAKNKVEDFLREFKPKERVLIKPNPSSHKGMPNKSFYGKFGEIKAKKGRAYVIEVKIGSKEKEIIANPEHLRKIK